MSIEKATSHNEDEEFEIEIVDDTPEEDQGRRRRPEGAEADIPDDNELASYSEKVRKRMSKMRFEYHEEKRLKDQAIREIEEAAKITKQLLAERNAYAERLSRGEDALIEQAKKRAEIELEQAEKSYKEAYEVGDPDKIIKAQKEISKLTLEQQQYDNYRSQPPSRIEESQLRGNRPAEPDDRAKGWLKSNPWFGDDEEMSGYAYGVHERLVNREKVNPLTDDYYNRIDAAMRRRFPEYFEDEGQREFDVTPSPSQNRRTPVVAPATRTTAQAPRKVTLTATQVALAKRLNLTNEQYAAAMVKEMMNG